MSVVLDTEGKHPGMETRCCWVALTGATSICARPVANGVGYEGQKKNESHRGVSTTLSEENQPTPSTTSLMSTITRISLISLFLLRSKPLQPVIPDDWPSMAVAMGLVEHPVFLSRGCRHHGGFKDRLAYIRRRQDTTRVLARIWSFGQVDWRCRKGPPKFMPIYRSVVSAYCHHHSWVLSFSSVGGSGAGPQSYSSFLTFMYLPVFINTFFPLVPCHLSTSDEPLFQTLKLCVTDITDFIGLFPSSIFPSSNYN